MKRRLLKRFLLGLGLFILLILVLVGRPIFHLAKTAWKDRNEIIPPPHGTVDDASRLNQTPVSEVWKIPTEREPAEKQLAGLLHRTRANHLKVAIAGARHTMGGHTIAREGVVIDMLPFNQMVLEESKSILHVQAGARWSQVIRYLNQHGLSVEIMQSNDDFSVGGSVSANCHGWQFGRPPIASSVDCFRLMLADGAIVNCSRTENKELFSLALGGYGLFGIILEVDLRVVPNQSYRLERWVVSPSDYARNLTEKTATASDVAMVYGRLCVNPDKFLAEAIINILRYVPGTNRLVSALADVKNAKLKRAVFRGGVGDDYGKRLRWFAETKLDQYLSGADFERNQLFYVPVGLYRDQSQATTDILMECFVPPAQFEPFLKELREIIPTNQVDLLNVTVRHIKRDEDTFLRYADQEMFSLVMLFSQSRDAQGEERMSRAGQGIIAAALRHEGRYYLPYRLHATPEQFAQAYPQAKAFFELKRKYDPDELFVNEFYRKYGKDFP